MQVHMQQHSSSPKRAAIQFGQPFYLPPEPRLSPPRASPLTQGTPTTSLCPRLGPAGYGAEPFAPTASPESSPASLVTAAPHHRRCRQQRRLAGYSGGVHSEWHWRARLVRREPRLRLQPPREDRTAGRELQGDGCVRDLNAACPIELKGGKRRRGSGVQKTPATLSHACIQSFSERMPWRSPLCL
ncbi:hypothetical protein E2542_SST06625 [Spatholobus suberectus]|nr:hypothetical protein E2542_SST06625 [Spatholobus suberectus]